MDNSTEGCRIIDEYWADGEWHYIKEYCKSK